MIEEVLHLISIFDIQIKLLETKRIKEMKYWQDLESNLITKIERGPKQKILPKDIYDVFNVKLKKKHYLIERHLSVNKKLLSVLRNGTDTYNDWGEIENKNFIQVVDKRI